MPAPKRNLGRGLSALIPPKPAPSQNAAPSPNEERNGLFQIPIDQVLPSDAQPRQVFDDAHLEELAGSIRDHGVLQPIVVRKRSPSQYEIVAGERRWRASQRAGLRVIPAVVADVAEQDMLTLALVENVQRQDLNPIEEAEAFQRLNSELGYSQSEIAKAVGKDRTTIANALRLLKLPQSVQAQVLEGRLSMGHARSLLALPSEDAMKSTAKEIESKGLSVRQTEALVNTRKPNAKADAPAKPKKTRGVQESDAERDVRLRVQRALATKVELHQKDGAGTLTLHFANFDELDRLLEAMGA